METERQLQVFWFQWHDHSAIAVSASVEEAIDVLVNGHQKQQQTGEFHAFAPRWGELLNVSGAKLRTWLESEETNVSHSEAIDKFPEMKLAITK